MGPRMIFPSKVPQRAGRQVQNSKTLTRQRVPPLPIRTEVFLDLAFQALLQFLVFAGPFGSIFLRGLHPVLQRSRTFLIVIAKDLKGWAAQVQSAQFILV